MLSFTDVFFANDEQDGNHSVKVFHEKFQPGGGGGGKLGVVNSGDQIWSSKTGSLFIGDQWQTTPLITTGFCLYYPSVPCIDTHHGFC